MKQLMPSGFRSKERVMPARLTAAAIALCLPIFLGGCQFLEPIADDADSGAFDPRKVLAVSFLVGGGLFLKSGGSSNSSTSTPTVGNDDGNTPDLPMPENNLMRSALDDYDSPDPLTEVQIRAGGDDNSEPVRAAIPITGFRYGDAATPDVFVQMLEFAALGIWVNGNAPEIGEFDHINYEYAFLGDNAVDTLPNSGTASYDIEGDATYKGVNFFPDGSIDVDFEMLSFTATLSAQANGEPNRIDDFGGDTAMVPDGGSGMRSVNFNDFLSLNFRGTIVGNTFEGTPNIDAIFGIFTDLAGFDSAMSSFSGRFYDSVPNPATAPRELSGVMEIVDAEGNLKMGFLGRRP